MKENKETEYRQKTLMLTEEQIRRVDFIINEYGRDYLPWSFSSIIRQALDEGLDNVENRMRWINGGERK